MVCVGRIHSDDALELDAATRRALELFEHPGGRSQHTLIGILDTTATPMGGRLLSRWLARPLRDRAVLGARLAAIGGLIDLGVLPSLREALTGLGDVERILARVGLKSARPRDLTTLRRALLVAPALAARLPADLGGRLGELTAALLGHEDTAALLEIREEESLPLLKHPFSSRISSKRSAINSDAFRKSVATSSNCTVNSIRQ